MTMIKNDPRPEGAPWLSPYMTVVDAQKTIHFFQDVFGFTVRSSHADDKGIIQHAEMEYQGKLVVMFSPEGAFGKESKAPVTSKHEVPLMLYLYVNDVDAVAKKVTQAGGEVVMQPEDSFWGDRFASVKDINGYSWGLGHTLGAEQQMAHKRNKEGGCC